MTVTRTEFMKEMRKTVGVACTHQGRSKHGLDCIGAILVTGTALNLTTLEVSNYQRRPDGNMMQEMLDKHLIRKSKKDMNVADILLLSEYGQRCHLGLVGTRDGRFTLIHASLKNRKVVENTLDKEGISRIVQVYQIPGVV